MESPLLKYVRKWKIFSYALTDKFDMPMKAVGN